MFVLNVQQQISSVKQHPKSLVSTRNWLHHCRLVAYCIDWNTSGFQQPMQLTSLVC